MATVQLRSWWRGAVQPRFTEVHSWWVGTADVLQPTLRIKAVVIASQARADPRPIANQTLALQKPHFEAQGLEIPNWGVGV